jgi:GTP-binding protein EngB required for normal cell division
VSPLLGRARTNAAPLADRLDALDELVDALTDRVEPALLADARGVLGRAGERLRLSAEHTVVALAGATGSGKSSLFNALSGLDISAVGVRRPVTSLTHACVWDGQGAAPLLDWLDVRHRVEHPSGNGAASGDLQGLILLDLPDHDSTVAGHRLQVDRLVRMVDLFIWVVDPQKYADAALHEHYLRPLATHAGVTVLALNQIDRVSPAEAVSCRDDLRRLLNSEGLTAARLVMVSARTGEGLPELREVIAAAVRERTAAHDRISADVDDVVAGLSAVATPGEGSRGHGVAEVSQLSRTALLGAVADAAGVPVVGAAVEKSWRARSVAATGVPWTRWVRRLRPDPLRRLHLEAAGAGDPATLARSSLPSATPVQRSRVETAVRGLADDASSGLPAPWVQSVRRAARARGHDLPDALDSAVVGTDLGVQRRPLWWRLIGFVQLVLAVSVAVGALWLLARGVVAWLGLPALPVVLLDPDQDPGFGWPSVPLPTLLVVGGLLFSVLVAGLSRVVARAGGRRRRRRVEAALRERIGVVVDDLVLAPVTVELQTYQRVQDTVARARR